MSTPSRLVILGASVAGVAAVAVALRAADAAGTALEVVVLDADADPAVPYDRPPLSKEMLLPWGPAEPVSLLHDLAVDAAGIDLRRGVAATGLARGTERPVAVVTAAGGHLEADAVVVAIGRRPRRAGNAPVLASRADALALRARLEAGGPIRIRGGGWIAAEAASAAHAHGVSVELSARTLPLLHRELGPVAPVVMAWADAAGVRLSEDPTGGGPVDLVAVGTVPVPFAICSAPVPPAGLAVDPAQRVLGPHGDLVLEGRVFAAGDATAGADRHWQRALHAGETAGEGAVAVLSGREPAPAPSAAAYSFSTLFGRELAVIGHAAGDAVAVRGGTAAGVRAAGEPLPADGEAYGVLAGGRLHGIVLVDRPRLVPAARRALAAPVPIGAEDIVDPATDLRRLLRGTRHA